MSDLEKFDVSKTKTRHALVETMGIFSFLGLGFQNTLSYVFRSGRPNGKNNQISKSLEKYERTLRRMRRKF